MKAKQLCYRDTAVRESLRSNTYMNIFQILFSLTYLPYLTISVIMFNLHYLYKTNFEWSGALLKTSF